MRFRTHTKPQSLEGRLLAYAKRQKPSLWIEAQPELGASVSRFEHLHGLQDPLLSQIVTSLAREIEGGFADLIMVESLSSALCIRIARRFVGYLSLPTTKGLSPERMRRVRDYIEGISMKSYRSPC
jgi:hypothetical protein